MGLQTGSTNVALFLFTVATFSLVVGAFALAVTVGEVACRGPGGKNTWSSQWDSDRLCACSLHGMPPSNL
jgi:hypothetical protein